MSPSLRQHKIRSVSDSLRNNRGHRSDQGLIWDQIDKLREREGVQSPTDAMHAVYEARHESLEKISKSFRIHPGQQGMFVLFCRIPIGLDFLSSVGAFKAIFAKLVRSYAMDALALTSKSRVTNAARTAKTFFDRAAKIPCTEHPSVGYGTDVRFTDGSIVGSALVLDNWVIHAAFFATESSGGPVPFAGVRQRRRFRE